MIASQPSSTKWSFSYLSSYLSHLLLSVIVIVLLLFLRLLSPNHHNLIPASISPPPLSSFSPPPLPRQPHILLVYYFLSRIHLFLFLFFFFIFMYACIYPWTLCIQLFLFVLDHLHSPLLLLLHTSLFLENSTRHTTFQTNAQIQAPPINNYVFCLMTLSLREDD